MTTKNIQAIIIWRAHGIHRDNLNLQYSDFHGKNYILENAICLKKEKLHPVILLHEQKGRLLYGVWERERSDSFRTFATLNKLKIIDLNHENPVIIDYCNE